MWDGFRIYLEIKLIGFASELNGVFERRQSQGSDKQIFFIHVRKYRFA